MPIKTINEPKMTVNKLGEFLVANPKRQRRILEQLKYPKDNAFGYTPYGDVRDAIKKYFIGGFDEKPITDLISTLEQKLEDQTLNDWNRGIVNSSIEALENVLDSDSINVEYTYEDYTGKNPKVLIHNVEISVNPDLIVKTQKRGKEYVGALKIHISKNSSINEDGSKYVSTLLHNYADTHYSSDEINCKNEISISYDVFNDTFVECPKSFKRRMEDIEAGCMNIKAIWDSI